MNNYEDSYTKQPEKFRFLIEKLNRVSEESTPIFKDDEEFLTLGVPSADAFRFFDRSKALDKSLQRSAAPYPPEISSLARGLITLLPLQLSAPDASAELESLETNMAPASATKARMSRGMKPDVCPMMSFRSSGPRPWMEKKKKKKPRNTR